MKICLSEKMKVFISSTVALGFPAFFFLKKKETKKPQLTCLLTGLIFFPLLLALKRNMPSKKKKRWEQN